MWFSTRSLAIAVSLALATCVANSPLRAQPSFPDVLNVHDRDRLAIYQPLRESVLEYVQQHAKALDWQELTQILDGHAIDVATEQLVGFWNCRLIRLVRMPIQPILVFQTFECELFEREGQLHVHQVTGSQRLAGAFYDIGETRLGYAGALTIGTETIPLRYGEQSERNQAGYLIPLSKRRLRLELPQPGYKSDFDILYFWR